MSEAIQFRQTVRVDDIRIEAFIGVHGHEKNRRQSLIVDVRLDIRPPGQDSITETIDYNIIVDLCRSLADEGIALIEIFARRLAQALIENMRVLRAEVIVTKPGALPNGTAGTSATLTRNADDLNGDAE